MKVLIVDDDQLTATTWAMGFKSAGLDVIHADNGQDGINQAKAEKPDIILLDQIMPDMLGNAVLTQLKSDPETANLPVMLISNYNENQMMKEAIEKGAIDYVLKYQVETKDLVEKVKTLLTDLQSTQPLPQTQSTTTIIDPSAPNFQNPLVPAAPPTQTTGSPTPVQPTENPARNNTSG